MKEQIKKAIESAEQEIQEKEIVKLKSIIKNLLQQKVDLEEDKRGIDKEIFVIKQTIDDFKAGRLDKVKELQEKDSIAEQVLPFRVVIVNKPVYTQPWNWTYQVTTTPGVFSSTQANSGVMGTMCSNFTSGTYALNGGRVISI